MNVRGIITLLVVAIALGSASGCGDTLVHDSSINVGPLPEIKVGPQSEKTAAPEPTKIAKPKLPVALPITFDDLSLNMESNVPFREEMLTDRVKELTGKRVRLQSVMHGSVLNQKQIEQFILLRNKEYKYGPGMPADILVEVKLQAGVTAKFKNGELQAEGTLRVEPKTGDDGNTWSIYILEEATLPIQQPAEN